MIGILGLQGDIAEHRSYLLTRYPSARIVKRPAELAGIHGLILPGGESTTITKLIRSAGLEKPVMSLIQAGLPVWGTCAGTILLCSGGIWASVEADIRRNAYGPQIHSAMRNCDIVGKREKVAMMFIRAPLIVQVSEGVEVLARQEEDIVAAKKGNILLTTFHPELTPEDPFFLEIFLDIVRKNIACKEKAVLSRRSVSP